MKRSGVSEPFSRANVVAGVRIGPSGRRRRAGVASAAGRGRRAASGCIEIPTQDVGLAVLGPLREFAEMAFLRFASVHRGFESFDDFEAEIALLRAERQLRPDEGAERARAAKPARP